MATFTRPPAPSCGSFAALGPQLQALAEAVDSDLQTLSTAEIFKALDAPFMSLTKKSTDPIDPVIQWPISFDVGFATVEASNGGGIIQGGVPVGGFPEAVVLPTTAQQYWYYIGVYLRSPVNTPSTGWKVTLYVDDTDPVTGNNRLFQFTRNYESPPIAATGNEFIWADFLVPSRGGGVAITGVLNANTASVDAGRFFVMQMAPRK